MDSFGFLIDEGERLEALLVRLQDGAPGGWRPNRIIFRNFWFFQEEEFWWHHGRLFLGGQNAAGKSTVLSMAIPFLLDGNKSEERLNTFGGQGRHMAYYVTGSPNPDDTSESAYYYPVRTSYLALEYYRNDPKKGDQYLTFGQGLHHDRNGEDKSVRSWGFVIRDGRRIGRLNDGVRFDLVRDNYISLNRADLKKLLGTGGEVYDTNREYKREVNRLLFGFKDPSDFDALIDLLLQIRRPKLTKEVRPRDVAEILTRSLPPLDESVMQITATSLDHIDQTTQNLERLAAEIEAAQAVEKAVRDVFRRIAEVAAAQYEKAYRDFDAAADLVQRQEAALAEASSERERAKATVAANKERLVALDEERRGLQERDEVRATEELAQKQAEAEALEGELRRLEEEVKISEDRIRQHDREIRATEARWESEQADGLKLIAATAETAHESRWETVVHWLSDLRHAWEHLMVNRPDSRLPEQIPRAAVAAGVTERLRQISLVEQAAAVRDEATASWHKAESEEQRALDDYLRAEATATEAANLFDGHRKDASLAVMKWATECEALHLDPSIIEQVSATLQRYTPESESSPGQALEPIHPAVQAQLRQVSEEESAHALRLRQLESDHERLQAERDQLNVAAPEPPRSPAQLQARALLAKAGFPCEPLFAVTDFKPDASLAEAAAVEQSLLDMGLLDALIIDADRRAEALELLEQNGAGDRLILTATAVAGLGKVLQPEAGHPLAGALARLLGENEPSDLIAALDGSGKWRHGLLVGVSLTPEAPRYIGRTTRERNRQAEILRVEQALRENEGARATERKELDRLRLKADTIHNEHEKIKRLPALETLERSGREYAFRGQKLQEARQHLAAKRAMKEDARRALDSAENQLAVCWESFPPARGLSRSGLQDLARRTRYLQHEFDAIYTQAKHLVSTWNELGLRRTQRDLEETNLTDRYNRHEEGAVRLRGLRSRCEGLRRTLDRPDAQEIFDRLAAIDRERPPREAELREADRAEAVAARDMERIQSELPELRQRAAERSSEATRSRQRLHDAVLAYPPLGQHQFPATDDAAARNVARAILARWADRPGRIESIQKEEVADRSTLAKVFEERRPTLKNYYPALEPGETSARLVQFNLDGAWVTPNQLLRSLEDDQLSMRSVLERHEADLFERHLLQDVGREVRRCLLKARDWVDEINELLDRYPLRNDERVWLDWSPKQTEHELGGTIARHAKLLWIEESDLTSTQRDALRSAFQEEVRQIRDQAKRGEWRADVFRQRLAEVLDYRTWFRFRIFVRGGVAGRTEITDTVHNARSGSERALVLLLPLLAGLSVRYESAASPEAPRLLALDEGFAGIDAVNSRQLIRFLTALRLTWVVSSEKLPALTEDLPGASFYAMLREGTVVAARPFVWDGENLRDAETELLPEDGDDYGN